MNIDDDDDDYVALRLIFTKEKEALFFLTHFYPLSLTIMIQ